MRHLLGIVITQLFIIQVSAQSDSCACIINFDDLVKKTETNYIGYVQKIKDNPLAEKKYFTFKNTIRKEAAKRNNNNCIEVLKKYTSYFKDGHVFVGESPDYTTEELKAIKTGIKKYPISQQQAIEYFNKNNTHLDPVEGIWYSENHAYELAVVKNPANKKEFFAVVLQSKNPEWLPGMVKAVFVKTDKEYKVQYFSGNFGMYKYEATIHRNAFMRIGPLFNWGKTFPTATAQSYIDKNNAGLPKIIKLDDDNVLVTIPTFLVEGTYLDSLVKSHYKELTSAKNLLVDVRGNGGGNAVYFSLITNLYYTRPYKDSRGLALSSPATIKYFERLASFKQKKPGDTSLSIYETVVRDMKANPGKIVYGPDWPESSQENISPLPQKVCIIIDKFCASAAESFIIHSKGFSDRITTFGENTSGMIDYTSVSSLPLLCNKQNFYFGYPTSTLHEKIPQNGYNETGIPPDVRIDPKVEDKVQFVLNWLKKQ